MPDPVESEKTIAVAVTDNSDKTVAIKPISLPPRDSADSIEKTVVSVKKGTPPNTLTQNPVLTSSTQAETSEGIDVGSTLKSRFTLESVLGIGGMGTVYKAKDLRQEEVGEKNPWLAIKILNKNISQHAFSWGALQRECKKTQQLSHPNIVSVFDFDKDGDTLFMSMELLDGVSLDEILNDPSFDGWPIETVDRLVSQVGDALSYAHSKGIAHSDLKPSNIFMTKDGDFKVYDFGIARAMHDVSSGGVKQKEEPLVALTPAYASIGMLLDEKATPADDLYAFGCVVYMAATSRHPYQRKSALTVLQEKITLQPPGKLSKRKSKVLCRILDVTSTETLNVDDFKRAFIHQSTTPNAAVLSALIVGVFLVILLALYISGYSDRAILQNLQSGDSIDVSAGMAEIQKMDVENRYRFLEQSRSELIEFYQLKANQLINDKRYLAAGNVLTEARGFYPDSIALSSQADDLSAEQASVYRELKQKGEALLFVSVIAIEELTADLPALVAALHHVKGGDGLLKEWSLDTWLAQKISASVYLGGRSDVKNLLHLADKLYPDDNRFSQHIVKGMSANSGNPQRNSLQTTSNDSSLAETEWVDTKVLAERSMQRIEQQKMLWGASSLLEGVDTAGWTPHQMKQFLEKVEQDNTEWGSSLSLGVSQFIKNYYQQYKQGSGKLNKQVAKQYQQLGSLLYPDVDLFHTRKRIIDPCKSWWAGKGRNASYQCRDLITSTSKGPPLVVIPSKNGSFAITSTEISVGQYNTYCRLYKRCRTRKSDNGNPVSNVSLQEVTSYARWLSKMTGFTYRVPTLSEWRHAIGAKKQQQLNDHNCLLTQGTKVIRGNKIRPVNSGTANAWGIKNGFGNVQEWVLSYSEGVKAGGSAATPLISCNLNYTVTTNENNNPFTGMRLVREL